VRPLLMTAMKSEPALIGPILTRMFSRYNIIALGLSVSTLILQIMATPSLATLFLTGALTLILALKLPFDKVIERRERAAQIRGIGEEGKRLNLLHKVVERATLAIIALSFASFVLSLLPAGQL
jgi:hypothetical protein